MMTLFLLCQLFNAIFPRQSPQTGYAPPNCPTREPAMRLHVAILLNLALPGLGLSSYPALAQNQTHVAHQVASNPNIAAGNAADPRDYLNEIKGEKALAWVTSHNDATLKTLSADPRFAANQAQGLTILQASDRIDDLTFAHNQIVRSLWRDADHAQGIWRQTTLASYGSGHPQWQSLLDIDALSKSEGKNWVWHSADCLPPEQNLCLISLSDGGKDATTIREFDVGKKAFVPGGFVLPEGKQHIAWRDQNTLYVTREWAPGELTASGYGYVTKSVRRGQPLDQAQEIFRGAKSDVRARRDVLRDERGRYLMDVSYADPSFFERHIYFYLDDKPVELPLPLKSWREAMLDGQAIYTIKDDWTSPSGTQFKPGDVVAFDLKTAVADPSHLEPVIVFRPNAHQSVYNITTTKDRLVLTLLSDVTGHVLSFSHTAGIWRSQQLDLPANAALYVQSTDYDSNTVLIQVASFLIPPTLVSIDAVTGVSATVKSTAARFDAAGLQVQQFWATSKDGTSVPYFLVARKDITLDGTVPTILEAYGGFEASMTPYYSGTLGKLWLQNGGAYVLANIRGGGEFGPKWHEAGVKTHRQRVYDDFAAVAQDLIARKITSPRRLGIVGASNGGLLVGVELTQRPDLWNAVILQVPLLDMVNYMRMSAGASWQGEYGNPDDPVEGAFLRSISPYHNVKAGVAYPEPLFETSADDDRVGPVHARKMAALFEDMGLPFYFYETSQGGHESGVNLAADAQALAIDYTYLQQKLMDK